MVYQIKLTAEVSNNYKQGTFKLADTFLLVIIHLMLSVSLSLSQGDHIMWPPMVVLFEQSKSFI
jgi:hypothetical protein